MFSYVRKATAMLAIVCACRKSSKVFAFVVKQSTKCLVVPSAPVHLLHCVHHEARPTLASRVVKANLASTLLATAANIPGEPSCVALLLSTYKSCLSYYAAIKWVT